MIGAKLKKYAAENGLKVEKGVAYGAYKGYMLTLKEGSGWKAVTFAMCLSDENEKAYFHMFLDNPDLKKQYRISGHTITDAMICVMFVDNPGTFSKLKDFVDMFCEQLASRSVPGIQYCSCCGLEMTQSSSCPVMINKNVFAMHDTCVEKVTEESSAVQQERRKNGNIFTGTLGAVLGGLVGAIPWAIVYYFGWFVGWLGFVIGIAAKKGYEIFRGKETKAKAVVIILVTILAVVAAEFITCIVSLVLDAELALYMDTSIPAMSRLILDLLVENAEFRNAFIMDVVLGWIFAGLGIFSTVKNIFSNTSEANGIPLRLDQ